MGAASTKLTRRLVSDINMLLKKRVKLSDLLSKLASAKNTPSSRRKLAEILVENQENVPRAAALKMRDVRDIVTGSALGVLVVEPQEYDEVQLLNLQSDAFSESRERMGWFHHDKSGLAHTGDGGDGGDLWWKACPALYHYLVWWVGTSESLLRGIFKDEKRLAADLKQMYEKNRVEKYLQ